MNAIEELNEDKTLAVFLDDLSSARDLGSLFVVIGAGVSATQLFPNWDQYVSKLINYWISFLDSSFGDSYIKNNENEYEIRRDMHFLDELLKRNVSNKRKVDIVYSIIKRHCRKAGKDINKILLSFERKHFLSINPMIDVNKILDNMINLQPVFLTTNYDYEIERRLRKYYGNTVKVVSDMSKIESVKVLSFRSIVYIHGNPSEETDTNYFISSSDSYSRLYYSDNSKRYVESFRKLISSSGRSLVLFIGCSMEEDEVLSLFQFSETLSDVKYYALMKYNLNYDSEEIEKLYNERVSKYYKDEKNINFIWYGKNYKDLPESTDFIVSHLKKHKFQILEGEINLSIYRKFCEADENHRIEMLNNLVDQGRESIVDSIIERYVSENPDRSLELVAIIINSNIINDNGSHSKYIIDMPNTWGVILERFNQVGIEQREKVLRHIKEIRSFNYQTERILYSIVNLTCSNLTDYRKYAILKEYFKKFLGTSLTNPISLNISDKVINAFWLIEKIESKVGFNYIDLKNNIYDLTKMTFQKLMFALKKIQNRSKYLNFDYIEDNDSLYTLEFLLERSRLTFEHSHVMPGDFYNNILIQKLYVKILTKDNEVINQNEIISNVINSIDFTNVYFGSRLNEFVLKYKELIKSNFINSQEFPVYRDYFREINIDRTSNYPIIDFETLSDKSDIDQIIKTFLEIVNNNHEEYVNDYFFQQNDNIINLVNSNNQLFENKTFLSDFMESILSIINIRDYLMHSITHVYIKGVEKGYLQFDSFKQIIKPFCQDGYIVKFDANLEKIMTKTINYYKNQENVMNEIIDHLFKKTDIFSLYSRSNIESKNYVSLISFLNSEIGRYINIVSHSVNAKSETILYSFKSNPLRVKEANAKLFNYIMGYLGSKIYQIDEIDHSFFIGYSHRYKLVYNDEKIEFFSKVCLDVFQSGIKDQYLSHNIALILISNVKPPSIKGKTSDELLTNVWVNIVNMYIYGNHESLRTLSDWIVWFIEKQDNAVQVIVHNTLNKLEKIDDNRLHDLNIYIRNASKRKNARVEIFVFSNIRDFEVLSIVKHNQILELMKVLVEKSYFNDSNILATTIIRIMIALQKSDEVELIKMYIKFCEENIISDIFQRLPSDFLKYK